jgi:predicted nucleotidyltransferase
MQPFIEEKREEIAELCRKYHVRRLSVFGSAVRDDFDSIKSDVDVIVEFEEIPILGYADNKWALRDGLAERIGRKVDLLTWKSVTNPYLLRSIEADQELLYAA